MAFSTSSARGRTRATIAAAPPSDDRVVLDSLLSVDNEESRPLTLMLHWAMVSMRAHWAAMYQTTGERGVLRRVAKASDSAKIGQSMFDFMTDQENDLGMALAMRAARLGTTIATTSRSKQQTELLSGSALATPLLDEDGQAVGCVVLLCVDERRDWSAEEQQLVAYAAPMFTLHAQRARLREQATWLAGLSSEDAAQANRLAERVGKAVSELKTAVRHATSEPQGWQMSAGRRC